MQEDESDKTLTVQQLLSNTLLQTLQHVHAHLDPTLVVDDRLLIQLVLAYYAGQRHLVLRLPSSCVEPASAGEQARAVSALAAQVAFLLAAVFAIRSHRVVCSPKHSAASFVRNMFVPQNGPGRPVSPPPDRLQRRSNTAPHSPLLGNTTKTRSPTNATVSSLRSRGVLGGPLVSDPAPIEESSAGEELFPNRSLAQRELSPDRRRNGGRRPTFQRNQRRDSAGSLLSTAPPKGPSLDGSLPAPARSVLSKVIKESSFPARPRAPMTVSYAMPSPLPVPEYLQEPKRSQSCSIPRVTSQPRTPTFQRRLSAEIEPVPSQPRELPPAVIFESLDRSRPSAQQALLDILRERRVNVGVSAKAKSGDTPPPHFPKLSADSSSLRELWALPKGFFIVAIIVDEPKEEHDDGAWGGVSRHLMDHFSCSYTLSARPAESLYPPRPTVSNVPLLPPSDALTSISSSQFISPSICTYLADLISTLRHHPLVEGRMITSRTNSDLQTFSRLWSVISKPIISGTTTRTSGAVLPEDVLAVLIGVTAHRMKMRKPEKEKSTFWGSNVHALRHRRVEGKKQEPKSVEDVVRDVAVMV